MVLRAGARSGTEPLANKSFCGAADEADQNKCRGNSGESNRRRNIRMRGPKPGQPNRQPTFPEAQADIVKGSGEALTKARAAVFPPCAMNATSPPSAAQRRFIPGERWDVTP